jgi:hypothetical protein
LFFNNRERRSGKEGVSRNSSNAELVRIGDALARTYDDVERNHTLQMAAALSYYFVLSIFPAPTSSLANEKFRRLPERLLWAIMAGKRMCRSSQFRQPVESTTSMDQAKARSAMTLPYV